MTIKCRRRFLFTFNSKSKRNKNYWRIVRFFDYFLDIKISLFCWTINWFDEIIRRLINNNRLGKTGVSRKRRIGAICKLLFQLKIECIIDSTNKLIDSLSYLFKRFYLQTKPFLQFHAKFHNKKTFKKSNGFA